MKRAKLAPFGSLNPGQQFKWGHKTYTRTSDPSTVSTVERTAEDGTVAPKKHVTGYAVSRPDGPLVGFDFYHNVMIVETK